MHDNLRLNVNMKLNIILFNHFYSIICHSRRNYRATHLLFIILFIQYHHNNIEFERNVFSDVPTQYVSTVWSILNTLFVPLQQYT